MTKAIKLESWAKTVDAERAEMEISLGRRSVIESELTSIFPKNVNAGYYFDTSLSTIIRMWITLEPGYDDDGNAIENDPIETSALKMMANAYTGHEGEKNIRKETGKVYWRYSHDRNDDNGKFEFLLMIENAHPMTCKITKVTKEVELYEMNCAD